MIEDNILKGDIFIRPNFLPKNEFEDLFEKVKKLDYIEAYQPSDVYFGNRFQAYPCYEKNDEEITNYLYSKIQPLFKNQLLDFQCKVRKTLTDELKISKVNTDIGIVHTDENNKFASVLQFDQTVNGGTAFFENMWDKYPDITIGSYPNRILIYKGKRNHAPMFDYTYKERYIIASFWN